jgi:transposase InsO family protein
MRRSSSSQRRLLRWHRSGFRLFWRWKSQRQVGRPAVSTDIRSLVRPISRENPLWGAPRIHGELLKLGIQVAQSTAAKYMVRRRGPPSQGWKTFLRNHAPHIGAIDMFVVPTIDFRLLYGLAIIHLERRRLVWINITANPTADWIARQITEAFPWDQAPQYLIRDRDASYGYVPTRRLAAMGIRDRPTAARSPWQNGHADRLIGSIRRECLDHVVVLGETHLRQVLRAYANYYNHARTHLALGKDAPIARPVQTTGSIMAIALLGGLPHQYARMV